MGLSDGKDLKAWNKGAGIGDKKAGGILHTVALNGHFHGIIEHSGSIVAALRNEDSSILGYTFGSLLMETTICAFSLLPLLPCTANNVQGLHPPPKP